jgi:DNA repair protein RadC
MTNPDPGSVISGTLRPQDLIPAFLDVLRDVAPAHDEQITAAAFPLPPAFALEDDTSDWWTSEQATDLLAELLDLLDEHAPDGHYFGAHPGDGADYGFWPIDDDAETDSLLRSLTSISDIESESATAYRVKSASSDDAVIERALEILLSRLKRPDTFITSPESAAQYVQLRLAEYRHEVFSVLWLDNRHGVLAFEELFTGTIDGAAVPPRTTVQRALEVNAAAVILCHNHPSGNAEPSQADQRITQRLRDALALVDVRVLDHLVVGDTVTSFAERGLL